MSSFMPILIITLLIQRSKERSEYNFDAKVESAKLKEKKESRRKKETHVPLVPFVHSGLHPFVNTSFIIDMHIN